MISLRPASGEIKDVLKHVYYCLGKDSIPYQDLVFFIAYDIKLFRPSDCEKILAAGQKNELIDISTDKIVTFNPRKLVQKQPQAGTSASVEDIVNELAIDHDSITKAIAIKPEKIVECKMDAKTGNFSSKFKTDNKEKFISFFIDISKKIVHQDLEDDIAGVKGKRVLLKHAIKAVLLQKDEPKAMILFRDVYNSIKEWNFTYTKI